MSLNTVKHINIGIIGDDPGELAQKLGKKTDEFDITYYDTVFQGFIYSILVPKAYPEKISALIQSIEFVDVVVLRAQNFEFDFSIGEIILLLKILKKPIILYSKDQYIEEKILGFLTQVKIDLIKSVKSDGD